MSEFLSLSHHDPAFRIYQNETPQEHLLPSPTSIKYIHLAQFDPERPSTSTAIPRFNSTQYQLLSECCETSV